MPKQKYALEERGEKRLEISWKALWKDTTIKLDGNPVGVIPNQKELTAGKTFKLPDGSKLSIQLVRKFSAAELQLLRNGQPLPGSATDPVFKHKLAYGVVYFIAGLNLVLGLVATLFQVEFLYTMGIGLPSILFGLVFLALGFFVMRLSTLALILASIIFALDGILGIVLTVAAGYSPGIVGIIARIFLLIPMVQGIGAIREIQKKSNCDCITG